MEATTGFFIAVAFVIVSLISQDVAKREIEKTLELQEAKVDTLIIYIEKEPALIDSLRFEKTSEDFKIEKEK